MRHNVHSHRFSRDPNARRALIKGLVISMVEHGRIKTTLTKAKELRRHVERAVTLGKKGSIHARRLLVARFGSEAAAETLVKELGVRFKTRPGGYTRILRLGLRPGDKAPMAYIEFVDYAPKVVAGEATTKNAKTTAKAKEAGEKAEVAAPAVGLRKAVSARAANARKARRNLQTASRRRNRA
jgi:large subunit ribosomal protein L17